MMPRPAAAPTLRPMPSPPRKALLPVLVLAAAGILAAETSVSGSVVTHSGRRTVALARVRVIARDAGHTDRFSSGIIAVTKTNEQGRYWFTGLPSPLVALSVERNGYYTRMAGGHEGGRVVLDCTQPEDCAQVDFEMGRAAAINGRVIDELGEPVGDASLSTTTSASGDRDVRRRVSADDRGIFRIANLQPGEYQLRVRGGRSRRFRGALEAEPTEVEVEEGDDIRGVQIVLHTRMEERQLFKVSGHLTGVDHSGSGAHMIALIGRGRGRSFVRLQEDGAFTAQNVRPGRYNVAYIHRSDSTESNGSRRVPLGSVEVNDDLVGLVLSPRPQTGLEGRVVFDRDVLAVGPPSGEVYLVFRGDDGEQVAAADAESPGFEFESMGLSPGTYEVDVSRGWAAPAGFRSSSPARLRTGGAAERAFPLRGLAADSRSTGCWTAPTASAFKASPRGATCGPSRWQADGSTNPKSPCRRMPRFPASRSRSPSTAPSSPAPSSRPRALRPRNSQRHGS